MVSEITKTIAEQVNWKALKFCGFRFVELDPLTLRINKGKKNFDIRLNEGLDLYECEKHEMKKDFSDKTEKIKEVYCEDLKDLISNFFKIDRSVLNIGKITIKEIAV